LHLILVQRVQPVEQVPRVFLELQLILVLPVHLVQPGKLEEPVPPAR